MRHLWRLLLGLSLVGLSVPFAWPTSAHAQVQGDQGLNGGWAVDDSGNVAFTHSISSSLPTMQQAGAGWVRVVFRLGQCYANWTSVGCNGRTALQQYDQVVSTMQTANLHVLAILTAESWPGSQADWTANNAETAGGNGDNAFTMAFGQAAGVLAQHFNGRVNDWEIWNEPNAWMSTDGQGHFSGSSYLYPSNYAWLLERSRNAIKSAEPSSHVMFGGLFAHESFTAQAAVSVLLNGKPERVIKRGDMPNARKPPPTGHAASVSAASECTSHEPSGADSGASYLCATYWAGENDANWAAGNFPFDDVGQHLYLALGGAVSGSTITSYVNDLRQAYVLYEGASTAKRTQVTEVGWPTDQVSASVESDNLRVAFQTLQGMPAVRRTYWFSTQDAPEAGLYYGIVDTNAAAKPAFLSYQRYATYGAAPVPVQPPVGNTPVQTLLQPYRLADTRLSAPIMSGAARCFNVAGQGGVPADAAGVVLNVTAMGNGASGWLTVYPGGQSVPATSTVNFDPSQYAMANSTIVGLGSGQVCVQVGASNAQPNGAHAVLDITGYITSSGATAMPLLSSPVRLVDTRVSSGPLDSGSTRCFNVAAVGPVPASATAVILNVTALGSGSNGWLSVYPAGQPLPATSSVNFAAGDYAVANTAVARVQGNQVCITAGTVNSAPGKVDVILDATGYLTSNASPMTTLLTSPERLVDTRTSSGPLASGGTRCFLVTGQLGIPTAATGVIVNVTSMGTGAGGWLTLFPSGGSLPLTSTLNYDSSRYAVANHAIGRLGSDGAVCVNVGTTSAQPGSAQVVLDVEGYLTP